MSLQIVTVQQKTPFSYEPYYFPEECYRSIVRFRVYPAVLGRGDHWGGHGDKCKLLKKALDENKIQSDYLIFSDSFDAIFFSHPDDILATFLEIKGDKRIIWGAEKACFSDASLAPLHPHCDTSYKYLNSGWAIGETKAFHEALREMDPDNKIIDDYRKEDGSYHHDNDQVHWQLQMIHGSIPIGLDSKAQLVWNMSATEDNEIEEVPQPEQDSRCFGFHVTARPKCIETGTVPHVIHLNGGAKNIYKDRMLKYMGLA